MIAAFARDVESKDAPFANLADLHRDTIHMQHETGKYLMHNAMRRALGQPYSSKAFEKTAPQVKQYLDRILASLTSEQP